MGQAERTAAILGEVLGDALLGAYLHGSAVQGGLRPRSDVDVLGVTTRPSTRDERRAIIEGLLPISGPPGTGDRDRPIELSVVVQGQVRPWRYPPALDLQYGEWWRAELARGEEPWSSPSPDLAIVLAAARAAARPLAGPPIAEVIDPVPAADVRRAIVDALPDLLAELDGDETNVVLTLARMSLTMRTGVIAPKDVAATEAMARAPAEHRAVIERARAAYLGESPDDWRGLEAPLRACADYLGSEVGRAAAPDR